MTDFEAGAPGGPACTAGALRLKTLKVERTKLRKQLAALEKAGRELEHAFGRVIELQSAQTRISEETAEEVRQWVGSGCCGPQPAPNVAGMEDLAKRLEVAQQEAQASAVSRGEVETGLVHLRENLARIEAEISAAIIADLDNEFRVAVADLESAVIAANTIMARCLGWREYLKGRGDTACMARAEQISKLRSPDFGATRQEVAAAAKEWACKFEELAE
jgi:hypothetical protein